MQSDKSNIEQKSTAESGMNILYLLETTDLCGGVKVVFNHAAYLTEKGHCASVASPDPYPLWFSKKVLFNRVDLKLFYTIPCFNNIDFVIATCPLHLPYVYDYLHELESPKLVHFVQGYEADCVEAEPFADMITYAYSLDIPKITVSERLCERLSLIYPNGNFMTCGQGLENDIFYPSNRYLPNTNDGSDNTLGLNFDFTADTGIFNTVILIGAFDISVKRVEDGLFAFKRALEKKKNLKLIRISAVDTKAAEEALIGKIDEYHVGITPYNVAQILRRTNGVLVSPSSEAEGFGLPPLEAMACGVPTVLTDIPSYRSFASPADYALFVPVGDVGKMADAIVEISDNMGLRYQLIKRGLEVSANYSYENVVKRLEKTLVNLSC